MADANDLNQQVEERNETDPEQTQENISNTVEDDDEFKFFYELAKRMILKRHEIGDVCTFSRWLKALEQNNNKIIKNAYIKLMVLALQFPEPTCPFKDPPPQTIDPLEHEVFEMARKFRKKEGTATCIVNEPEEVYPSMSTAVSNDKCQYASSHVIPNVGVQCFYAYSDEPLYNWLLPGQITIPKSGPHAKDIEWERALAGIQLESHTPVTDNGESETIANSEDGTDICQVMYIEQQNRNVTEEFGWNDASLLTGEIILGAEPCSDRKVDIQVKTQIVLDEESVNTYDKLYPGDFKIYVEPSFVEDIMPAKKLVDMEAGDKTNEPKVEKCTTKKTNLDDCKDNSKPQNCKNGKKPVDNKKVMNSKNYRQSAGHGIFKLPKSQNYIDKKQNIHRNKLKKISSNLSNLMKSFVSCETLENAEPRSLKSVDTSAEEVSGINREMSEYAYHIESVNKKKFAFQKASSDFRRTISTAEECFDDKMSVLRAHSKSAKNISDMDMDTSDAS